MIESIRSTDASNPVCIKVAGLSKTYHVWQTPFTRLARTLADEVHRPARRLLGEDHWLTRRAEQRMHRGHREVHALRQVSLEIQRGEVVGIIGYNGSGKSTLLQILAGTLTPTSGRVEVHGRVAALLELGSGINPEFTGRENAFLYGAILGFSREFLAQRMHAIEEFAEIGEFMDEPVKTYSTGMVARLAFSVLTQLDPDILIVDEALSVGDAYFQNKSINLIRRFQAAGKTMLVVSHAPETIKSMCTRAVILERGTVIREGSAAAVCDYYNALVAKKQRDDEIRQVEHERGRVITRSGNRQVTIGDVELLAPNRQPARAFTVGEEAHVACALEFRGAMLDPTVGVLVRDRLGNDVFGSNTFHQRKPLGSFKPGDRCEVTFSLRLNLAPGRYSVSVAVHSGRDHLEENYDWQDNVVVFDVLPGSENAFIGTAWLPLDVHVERETVGLLRHYDWGRVIDFSTDGDSVRFRQGGWSIPEPQYTWTDGGEANLRFQLPASTTDRVLRVRAAGFCTARVPHQRVYLQFDGRVIGEWQVGETAEFTATIPRTHLAEPAQHQLKLVLPDAISPEAEDLGKDSRLLAIRIFTLTIE